MAVILGAFLLWLFATGEYAKWLALVVEPAKPVATSSGSTTNTSTAGSTQNIGQLINTGSSYINSLSGSSSGTTTTSSDSTMPSYGDISGVYDA